MKRALVLKTRTRKYISQEETARREKIANKRGRMLAERAVGRSTRFEEHMRAAERELLISRAGNEAEILVKR